MDFVTEDVLRKIFSFLQTDLNALINARHVSRKWKHICDLLLNKLEVVHFHTLFPESNYPKGRKLNRSLDFILKLCGNGLKYLDLHDPEPEPRTIRINETTFNISGRRCGTLEKLDLSGLYLINDHLLALASNVNCSKIIWLNMNVCFNHSCTIYTGLDALYKVLSHVQYLNLSYSCSLRLRDSKEVWPATLQQLHMNQSTNLSDFALIRLAKVCPNLQTLSLNYKGTCFNGGLEEVFSKLTNLHTLSLKSYEGPESLGILIGNLHKLTELYLTDSSFVTDSVIQAVAFGCRNLEVIHCNLRQTDDSNDRLSDTGLLSLATFCKSLKQLNVSCRQFISNLGVAEIVKNGKIECLSMNNCANVGAEAIEALSNNCSHLFCLEIDNLSLSQRSFTLLCDSWFSQPVANCYELEVSCENVLVDYHTLNSRYSKGSSPGGNEFYFVSGGIRRKIVLLNDVFHSWWM